MSTGMGRGFFSKKSGTGAPAVDLLGGNMSSVMTLRALRDIPATPERVGELIEEVAQRDPHAARALRVLQSEGENLARIKQSSGGEVEGVCQHMLRRSGPYGAALEEACSFMHVPGVREAIWAISQVYAV